MKKRPAEYYDSFHTNHPQYENFYNIMSYIINTCITHGRRTHLLNHYNPKESDTYYDYHILLEPVMARNLHAHISKV